MPAESTDKFQHKMAEAVQQMSNLCNAPIENSPEGIHYALACAMKVGTPSDKATAVLVATRYMWAHCEYEYHSSAM